MTALSAWPRRAAELLGDAERYQPELGAVAAELRDSSLRMQEAAIELRAQLDGLEPEPGRLEHVEQRLLLFSELEHRFGTPAADLPARCAEAQAALDLIDTGGRRLAELEAALAEATTAAERAAARLHAARSKAAKPFSQAVEAELADLGMDGARLQVQIEPAELGVRGADRVTLLLAANAGLPPGPIASVASGGELSRIALAVRVVARSAGGAATLLLDEVDAGVGGRTAHAVAEKLKRLSAGAQLLCITHLPQIAGVGRRALPGREGSGRSGRDGGRPARGRGDRRGGRAHAGRPRGRRDRPAARRRDAGLTAARAAVVVLAYDAFPGPVTLGKVDTR